MSMKKSLERILILLSVLGIISNLTTPVMMNDTPSEVFSVTDLHLLSNQSYSVHVFLESNAPHNITSTINPVDPLMTELAIYVTIISERGSLQFGHRGDVQNRTVSFTPLSHLYTLEISNMGHINCVVVNLTIVQVGSPVTHYYPQEDLLLLLFSVVILITFPVGVVVVILIIIKRRKLR